MSSMHTLALVLRCYRSHRLTAHGRIASLRLALIHHLKAHP